MSRISMKNRAFQLAELIWRRKAAVVGGVTGAAAALGYAVASAGWSFAGAAAMPVAGVVTAFLAIAVSGIALKLRSAARRFESVISAEREAREALSRTVERLSEIEKAQSEEFRRLGVAMREASGEMKDARFVVEERTNSAAVEISRLRKHLEGQTRRIERQEQALEKLALRERESIKRINELENRSAASARTIEILQSRAAAEEQSFSDFKAETKRRAHAADVNDARILAQFKKIDEKLAVKASAEETRKFTADAAGQFRKIDERLAAKARVEKLVAVERALSDVGANLETVKRQLRGHHVHERHLSAEDVRNLIDEWAAPLGFERTDANIHYLASRIRSIESRCSGRLATASQTMIARMFAAQSVRGEVLDIIEIGVLFGVASACFHGICSEFGKRVKLTLIDPFEGYYDRGAGDLITGAPVSRSIFERNMAACGVPPSDYDVIEGMSDDPAVIDRAGRQTYDVLLIDGDHTFDGVRRDFENYRAMVRKGGVILFDDYEVREWPDIKNFVDDGPMKDPGLELLAKGFRTAAFRVL